MNKKRIAEQKRALTSTCSELEMLRPGSVADDVTSGAETFVDWYPVESADDPECTGRMMNDHCVSSTRRLNSS